MSAPTEKVAVQPGMGKWNRKKRMQQSKATKKVAPIRRGKPITKDERREKYTAIARERQLRAKSKHLMCYNCRESGHSVQHCPKARLDDDQAILTTGTPKNKAARSARTTMATTAICYKCGSTEHTLAACPKKRSTASDPNGCLDLDLPFATCFVCQAKGHLASGCPNNANGIYINGGECKHCGSKQHRGTQCPEKKKDDRADKQSGRVVERDYSDLLDDDSVRSSSPPAVKAVLAQATSSSSKAAAAAAAVVAPNRNRRVVNF